MELSPTYSVIDPLPLPSVTEQFMEDKLTKLQRLDTHENLLFASAKLRRAIVRSAFKELAAEPFDWDVYGVPRYEGPNMPRTKKGRVSMKKLDVAKDQVQAFRTKAMTTLMDTLKLLDDVFVAFADAMPEESAAPPMPEPQSPPAHAFTITSGSAKPSPTIDSAQRQLKEDLTSSSPALLNLASVEDAMLLTAGWGH